VSEQAASSEKAILILASTGDESAFALLFQLYKNKLYAYLLRLTESEMLAEDIVQDVFMKLWHEHQSLSTIDNFGSYLFRMSKNHVINHFRRMSHETLLISEMFQADPSHNATEEVVALNETEKLLSEIIDQLPPQQKTIYQLSRQEGRSHDEIAQLLKISPNTVKNHMVQAMSTIRTQLRRHSDTFLFLVFIAAFKK